VKNRHQEGSQKKGGGKWSDLRQYHCFLNGDRLLLLKKRYEEDSGEEKRSGAGVWISQTYEEGRGRRFVGMRKEPESRVRRKQIEGSGRYGEKINEGREGGG